MLWVKKNHLDEDVMEEEEVGEPYRNRKEGLAGILDVHFFMPYPFHIV